MKNLMMFEGNEVEVLEFNGEILFNAKDVAMCLEISNINKNITTMEDYEVVKVKNSDITNGYFRKLNNAGENFLTEAGVYSITFLSRKESAKRFKKWVVTEVLPSIRKNEGYIQHQETMSDVELLAKSALVAQKLIEEKQARIEELEPQAFSYKILMDTKDNIDFADFVKSAKLTEGRNDFMKRLRKEKILMKGKVTPRQAYVKQGYFQVVQAVANGHSVVKTVITKKGQDWLVRKCSSWNLIDIEA